MTFCARPDQAEKKEQVRVLRLQGMSSYKIAREIGVSPSYVKRFIAEWEAEGIVFSATVLGLDGKSRSATKPCTEHCETKVELPPMPKPPPVLLPGLPPLKPGNHYHRCPKCGYIWQHPFDACCTTANECPCGQFVGFVHHPEKTHEKR